MNTDHMLIDTPIAWVQDHDNIFWGTILLVIVVGVFMLITGNIAWGIPITMLFGLMLSVRVLAQIVYVMD